MKTLDEVIKAFDNWMPDCDSCVFYCDIYGENNCTIADALHYLKEYRDKHEEMLKMEEALGYCEMADNRPLTWDELKQMFHKPVWIETKTKKCWVIINNFEAVTPNSENVNVIHTSHNGAKYSHFARHLMGQTWQAYRKER